MRPRVFPAEDSCRRSSRGQGAGCFNEAAGIPRGRHGKLKGSKSVKHASMRPRVFPAEDATHSRSAHAAGGASMRPRVFPAEDNRTNAQRSSNRRLQ